jgi:hypothetical protein
LLYFHQYGNKVSDSGEEIEILRYIYDNDDSIILFNAIGKDSSKSLGLFKLDYATAYLNINDVTTKMQTVNAAAEFVRIDAQWQSSEECQRIMRELS